MIMMLSTVPLYVADQERSKQFYVDGSGRTECAPGVASQATECRNPVPRVPILPPSKDS